MQVFWFRHMFLLAAEDAAAVQQLVVQLLGDKKLEVQELAARTLSGLIQVRHNISAGVHFTAYSELYTVFREAHCLGAWSTLSGMIQHWT